MELRKMMYENFGKISKITINISPGVTLITGPNGACKTTVGLNGVWFVLKGLAQKGQDVFHAERFRFIGKNGKSAKGVLFLHDEKENIDIEVTRKLTKTATTLKITASDDRQLDQAFLDEIFNVFTINLFSFSKLSPKDQARALGLDTAKYDATRERLYVERRDVGREAKRLKAVADSCTQTTEVEAVNLTALLKEKEQIDLENAQTEKVVNEKHAAMLNEIREFNREQKQIAARRSNIAERMAASEAEIHRLQTQLKALREDLAGCPVAEDLKNTEVPPENHVLRSTERVSQQIEAAESTNEHARQYKEHQAAFLAHRKEHEKYIVIENQYIKTEIDKVEYIKGKKLPFSNMTIDEDGGLLVGGKPFCEPYFSKGEIMRMSAKLAMTSAGDDKLRYIFIPDAQSLDEPNRDKLFKELVDSGFQVMAELVGDQAVGDNSILLREGRVVEGEGEAGKSL